MFIKINLLGERKKKGAKTALWLSSYVFALGICALSFLILLNNINSELSDKDSQSGLLEAQLTKLKIVTKEVRDLSAKKNSLAEKIAVMAALKKKKAGPVRVLDDLNISIPEKSWITDIKELEGGLLKISGFALDNQTIAVFMKALDASDYFSNVDLVETKQTIVKGIGIKEFILQSKVNYLGKLVADQAPIILPTAVPVNAVEANRAVDGGVAAKAAAVAEGAAASAGVKTDEIPVAK